MAGVGTVRNMSDSDFRVEHDSMGEVRVPASALWKAQTQRAVENFPISGTPIEPALVHALGEVKAAAARANADLGLLPADLAGAGAHPNDHVNMGQSSNDVFPSAVHLAALDEATHRLLPALERLEASLAAKAEAFADIVKSGRTHLMDAVPVTLGQEFSGYAAQVRLGRRAGSGRPAAARSPPAAGRAGPVPRSRRTPGPGSRARHP